MLNSSRRSAAPSPCQRHGDPRDPGAVHRQHPAAEARVAPEPHLETDLRSHRRPGLPPRQRPKQDPGAPARRCIRVPEIPLECAHETPLGRRIGVTDRPKQRGSSECSGESSFSGRDSPVNRPMSQRPAALNRIPEPAARPAPCGPNRSPVPVACPAPPPSSAGACTWPPRTHNGTWTR